MFAAEGDTQRFPAGHRFFSVGDTGAWMFVVLSGEVEISLRGKTLETVHPGGIFGEMALIDHHERSADVTAKTEVEAARVDARQFMRLISQNPFFALEVMKVMTARLRAFDDLL